MTWSKRRMRESGRRIFRLFATGAPTCTPPCGTLLAEYARRSRIVPIELLGEIDSLNLISDEPGPDRQVGARQELERLRAIVAALPAQCRRVFELRKFDGLSHRDVAQKMGLSKKTVENHLTRALARIGAILSASARVESIHPELMAKDMAEGIDHANH